MSSRTRAALGLLLATYVLGGCRSSQLTAGCVAAAEADRIMHKAYNLVCSDGEDTPPPRPEATPTTSAPAATATAPALATPTSPATPPPAGPTLPPNLYKCIAAEDGAVPSFVKMVRDAIGAYKLQHPEQFSGPNHLASPMYENPFYDGVVANLNAAGWPARVDDCGGRGRCGEINVAPPGSSIGDSFSDNYNVLTSGDDVRDPITGGGFKAFCRPRWW